MKDRFIIQRVKTAIGIEFWICELSKTGGCYEYVAQAGSREGADRVLRALSLLVGHDLTIGISQDSDGEITTDCNGIRYFDSDVKSALGTIGEIFEDHDIQDEPEPAESPCDPYDKPSA